MSIVMILISAFSIPLPYNAYFFLMLSLVFMHPGGGVMMKTIIDRLLVSSFFCLVLQLIICNHMSVINVTTNLLVIYTEVL